MKKVWTWQLWDWKSIRLFVLTILGLIVALYFMNRLPDFFRKSKNTNMTAVTNGQYVSSTNINERRQGGRGSRTGVVAISVEYSYMVSGFQYYGTDDVPIGPTTDAFFQKLNNDKDLILSIIYNPKNPQESQIDTNY